MKSWDALACPVSLKKALQSAQLKSRRPRSNLDFIRGIAILQWLRFNLAGLLFQLAAWMNHHSCKAFRFGLIGRNNKEGNELQHEHGLILSGKHLLSPLKPHGKTT